MKLMFGELLEEIKNKSSIKEKIEFLKKNRTKVVDDVVKTFLVEVTEFKIQEPATITYKTSYYDPSRMTHLYPEFQRFKRIFIERNDIPQEKLKKSFLELVKNLPAMESKFIVESIETGESDILTREIIEGAFPEFFEVSDASVPVSM